MVKRHIGYLTVILFIQIRNGFGQFFPYTSMGYDWPYGGSSLMGYDYYGSPTIRSMVPSVPGVPAVPAVPSVSSVPALSAAATLPNVVVTQQVIPAQYEYVPIVYAISLKTDTADEKQKKSAGIGSPPSIPASARSSMIPFALNQAGLYNQPGQQNQPGLFTQPSLYNQPFPVNPTAFASRGGGFNPPYMSL